MALGARLAVHPALLLFLHFRFFLCPLPLSYRPLAPPHLGPTPPSSGLSCNYPPAFLRANGRSSWKLAVFQEKPTFPFSHTCSMVAFVTCSHAPPTPGLILSQSSSLSYEALCHW